MEELSESMFGLGELTQRDEGSNRTEIASERSRLVMTIARSVLVIMRWT